VYAYHATIAEFLPSIAAHGLRASYNAWLGEDVIFVEPDREGSAIYLEPGRGVMLRMNVPGIGSTPDGECVLYDTPLVPAAQIEVERDGSWISILDLDFGGGERLANS